MFSAIVSPGWGTFMSVTVNLPISPCTTKSAAGWGTLSPGLDGAGLADRPLPLRRKRLTFPGACRQAIVRACTWNLGPVFPYLDYRYNLPFRLTDIPDFSLRETSKTFCGNRYLLEIGAAICSQEAQGFTAMSIAEETGIHYQRVHEVLQRLEKGGAIHRKTKTPSGVEYKAAVTPFWRFARDVVNP